MKEKIECPSCGKNFLEKEVVKIFSYDLCHSCGMLIEMLVEGFLKNHAETSGRKFKSKRKQIIKDVHLENDDEKKCRKCPTSFIDFETRKVSCTDELDPATCGRKMKGKKN